MNEVDQLIQLPLEDGLGCRALKAGQHRQGQWEVCCVWKPMKGGVPPGLDGNSNELGLDSRACILESLTRGYAQRPPHTGFDHHRNSGN
jgi:hypothetical protein